MMALILIDYDQDRLVDLRRADAALSFFGLEPNDEVWHSLSLFCESPREN
jgi:hypothetical protein